MVWGQFSFYAVREDQSVAAWDMLKCEDEAAAAEHAITMVALHSDATAVEVWNYASLCFTIPAAPYRKADEVTCLY